MPGVCCGCNAPGRAKCNSKHEERQSETCQAFVSVLVASLGSLTLGYAMGYPSSALIELTDASKLQQPADYAFAKGSPTSDLFGVSFNLHELFPHVDGFMFMIIAVKLHTLFAKLLFACF